MAGFHFLHAAGDHGADSVKIPYLCFAGVFLLLAVLFKFAHLPGFANTEQIGRGAGALKHPHTALGMVAIFMYVGGEVGVGSVIVNFLALPRLGGVPHETASGYLAFYWGGLMIGRFMGAFALSEIKPVRKHILVVLTPLAALGVILGLPGLAGAMGFAGRGARPNCAVWPMRNTMAFSCCSCWRPFLPANPIRTGCWPCSASSSSRLLGIGIGARGTRPSGPFLVSACSAR